MRMTNLGQISVARKNTLAKPSTMRSMMVMALRRLFFSPMPQKRAVSTEAPIPMPMQKI